MNPAPAHPRAALFDMHERLEVNPILALLGPRQCGKTTLAREFARSFEGSVVLDLERHLDLEVLREPELFLERHVDKLVVIDEIQLRPDLFGVLRAHVDRCDRRCRILILGSASRELIRQGAESLAGRASFLELTPFRVDELPEILISRHWERGGFPRSLLAKSQRAASLWREDYLRALVERDLPMLGLKEPPLLLRRLLSILGHYHGEVVNFSKMGESLGLSNRALPGYLDFLEGTFMIRSLPPFHANLKKRLVKSPKIYYRDCGIFQTVMNLGSFEALMGSPYLGSAWEGFVMEQLASALGPDWKPSFFRTQAGAEIDLIFERGTERFAVECKASAAPSVSRGFWSALEDLEISETRAWVVCPIDEVVSYRKGATIGSLDACLKWAKGL